MSDDCGEGCTEHDTCRQRQKRKPVIETQNPDGSWSPAEPLGWMEEHNRVERFRFWLRGIEHCNDYEGQLSPHTYWRDVFLFAMCLAVPLVGAFVWALVRP